MLRHRFIMLMSLMFVIGLARSAEGQKFKPHESKYQCGIFYLERAAGKPGKWSEFTIRLHTLHPCKYYRWNENKDEYEYRGARWLDAQGTYEWGSKWAHERITIKVQDPKTKKYSDAIIHSKRVSCSENPWIHGPSCDQSTVHFEGVKSTPVDEAQIDGINVGGVVPVSAYLLKSEDRNTLAKWESTPLNEELLADWKPLPQKGVQELDILRPGGAFIPADAAFFELDLKPLAPLNGTVVLIEWARIGQPKDPSLSNEQWYANTPAQAPKAVSWSELPRKIYTSNRFAPGQYAMRVRMKNSGADTWTEWKRFWIGPPKIQIPVFKKALPD